MSDDTERQFIVLSHQADAYLALSAKSRAAEDESHRLRTESAQAYTAMSSAIAREFGSNTGRLAIVRDGRVYVFSGGCGSGSVEVFPLGASTQG
jgi:hypothetical protein